MKNLNLFTLLLAITGIVYSCNENSKATTVEASTTKKLSAAEQLIGESINAMGGIAAYRNLEDVTYTYAYRNAETGEQDVSTEKYAYADEKSWAEFTERTYRLMKDQPGVLIQGYNGNKSWATLDGKLLEDEAAIKRADFNRKTNFYWFNMMFKLLDPGLTYELLPEKEVNENKYDIVKVGFGENIGDAQDIYILYINKATKLIDQFLFTVMDFDRADPLLMEVKYEEVNGLKWPTFRRYTPSDWEANVSPDANWIEEISTDVKFNTGLEAAIFELPM